jgi:hypothetical protein
LLSGLYAGVVIGTRPTCSQKSAASADQSMDQFWMDLHNNRQGRDIAFTGKTPTDLLNSGMLRTLEPNVVLKDWRH